MNYRPITEDILVVDDIPANLKLLRDILKEGGYQVRLASDGELALRSVKASSPMLILLDIHLPDINGLEVSNRLKADPVTHDIPIIFISALSTLQDKVLGFAAGGVDYITKPFNKLEVLARVNTHISLRHAQLTQEAQAQQLQEEIRQRMKAEAELQKANVELDARVQTRVRELSEANAALLASKQRYSDLYNNSPDMYVSVEADTALIRQCNQTLADKLGYSKTDIIDRPIFDLYHPDCMVDVKKAFHSFIETGEVQDAELQLKRHDGNKIDVNLNVTAVRDENGKILYSRSCWIDISKRKQTEQELSKLRHYLQNVFDSMPSVLVGVRPDGSVSHWNQEAEHFSGIDAIVAQNKRVDKLLPLLSGRMYVLEKALQESTPQRIERIVYEMNDVQHYADIMVYPLSTDHHEGAMIRIDDITERVHVEDMMVQTEKMLSVGGLAAGMAHEINNPLGGIMQGQQNILRRFSTQLSKNREVAEELSLDLDKVSQYMERRQILYFLDGIAKAGKRASTIVENMLHFSRKEEYIKPVNINKLLDLVLELATIDYDLKKKYDFRTIEIQRDYDSELPQVFCIDSEIQQVILNILRNSAQALQDMACREKASVITIKTQLKAKRVHITIEDNGSGMDEKSRCRAFEPFFTTKPVGIGTGLGLSVSYFIITNIHGGEMQIESKPGMGTKLIIILPVK